ncbi:MAG: hypothetical protein GW762_04795 [Candidatus Pacebacteria bacterium]|nr:hypothetical protein [Candidatus Paceibacterota bacterium]PIR63261.1 MAG: hypothetical protein COU64_05540 [Candidatus Pacebacteria bacterium CG10_big_fil_rev_8_21_14_0_10_40_26]PIZ78317.1 MAG: hypothetical protein COY01_06065 [Candidatus Pacebacteria bacterium CG_4_10_14_0_2_um_filter_40_20]PJA68639.1 MAG: hypothetical protein CO156_03980 [Candidatus Pacebacteria bacterium CG_4_9_14_3_um_filter_40_12]PJC41579.1 MAG: hypothetical protein CO041_02570 [Candidatus Pacebacteria bacterium CG_4_9_
MTEQINEIVTIQGDERVITSGEIIEDEKQTLLAQYDRKTFEDLSPADLHTLLENLSPSAQPTWIEVTNIDRAGTLYFAVDGQCNTVAFAVPNKERTVDHLGSMTEVGGEIHFYGTTFRIPFNDFVSYLGDFSSSESIIAAIHAAENSVRDKYRNRNNTVPLPSTSSLSLDGKFGAKAALIKETLIAPQQPAGQIYEEIGHVLTEGLQQLPLIEGAPRQNTGEIITSNEIGYLSFRLNSDFKGDTLAFSFNDTKNGLPLFTAKYFIPKGEKEMHLSHLVVNRHSISEQHGKQVLRSKHLQIADELRYSWGLIRPEGAALKEEARVLEIIRDTPNWSSRFGDDLEVNDPWVAFEEGVSVDQEDLKAMISEYINTLLLTADVKPLQLGSINN